MARIAGVNIPTQKRVVIALTYIHGIGTTKAREICSTVGIPAERRVNQLTDDEVVRMREAIDRNYMVEGDLRREVALNIRDGDFRIVECRAHMRDAGRDVLLFPAAQSSLRFCHGGLDPFLNASL